MRLRSSSGSGASRLRLGCTQPAPGQARGGQTPLCSPVRQRKMVRCRRAEAEKQAAGQGPSVLFSTLQAQPCLCTSFCKLGTAACSCKGKVVARRGMARRSTVRLPAVGALANAGSTARLSCFARLTSQPAQPCSALRPLCEHTRKFLLRLHPKHANTRSQPPVRGLKDERAGIKSKLSLTRLQRFDGGHCLHRPGRPQQVPDHALARVDLQALQGEAGPRAARPGQVRRGKARRQGSAGQARPGTARTAGGGTQSSMIGRAQSRTDRSE